MIHRFILSEILWPSRSGSGSSGGPGGFGGVGGLSPLPPFLLPSLLRGGWNASLDPEPLDCSLADGALLDAALLG